jgi:MoaA/NifB/PqqE/SkfB family radical SAM enzyme
MTLENYFCASPWLHMRIDPQGNFRPCRWRSVRDLDWGNIAQDSAIDYFQEKLSGLRSRMLSGQPSSVCTDCYHMEQHGKVSGRQRQLLKVGIDTKNFVKTLMSSTMLEDFLHSERNHGRTDLVPQDWQIDLGNYCNSACIFCSPEYSSRLALEHKKLGLIDRLPGPNWADDPVLVDRFCAILNNSSDLAYLHFLGGETLITPAFKVMLRKLLDRGFSKTHIGFTTNLTVWPDEVISLLSEFQNLHVGMSIECLHRLNDYVRWPSRIDQVQTILHRWIDLSKSRDWYLQIRSTPNCFTLYHIDTLYQFAYDNDVGIETCNFIERPPEFRINALDPDLMEMSKQRIKNFLDKNSEGSALSRQIVNTRNKDTLKQQVWQDARSYYNYLQDESHMPELVPKLVRLLKLFESNRNNSILDYLPEYGKFLAVNGY